MIIDFFIASNFDDYNFSAPQTITFPANSSDAITLDGTIVNDALSEPDETITLALFNPTNQSDITNGSVKITIIDDDGLGIETSGASYLSIYPSIGNGIFHISSTQSFALNVFDIYGNKLRFIENIEGDFSLDLKNLASGFYFLRFENESGMELRKVMIR